MKQIALFCFFSFLLVMSAIAADAVAQDSEPITAERFELVPKKTIPYSLLGINAFVNEPRFGSIRSQFREVRNTLRIKHLRVLMRWDDNVQPTPRSKLNFSFYDSIINELPTGSNAVIVLTGIPSWMKKSENWIDNDVRKTFVEKWVRVVVTRYAKRGRVLGWQIWNEPNMASDLENQTLELDDSPENYLALLSRAYSVAKQIAPRKLVVSAATTAINQNFPETFSYNQSLKEGGIEENCDIWSMHYYGSNYERLLFLGISDFLNSISKPIWVTESGAQGTTKQLAYGQRTWPLLKELVPNIARIYIYQFTESTPAAKTYGLKNITAGSVLSDLYINLRDRK